MSATLTDRTVGEIVAASPTLAVVFERFGIDYCCGGKQSLEAACRNAGVALAEVQAALEGKAGVAAGSAEPDWTQASLESLVLNILNTHHAYLRAELPRLSGQVEKIARVHGDRHPELREVADVFMQLNAELVSHMMKEEQILFPAIVQLERTQTARGSQPWLNNPIRVMEDEHAAVGQMLAQLQKLTVGYTPPADACNTYRVAFDGLQRLEFDLHRHIHKENSILFPRADLLERQQIRS